MKNFVSLLSLAVAASALIFAGISFEASSELKKDIGRTDPGDTVRAYMEFACTYDFRIQAERVFEINNSEEILDTLDVSDVAISEHFAVVFFRYSIGTDIYRKTMHLMQVDEKWYSSHEWSYSSSSPADEDWYKEVSERVEKWEKDSAKSIFEY
ncbi:MAG: hypothetical protein HN848_05750 [Thiotrichales bacterium]|mgnify:FL=1|jgi:hypothetical protein|nr:hypothetical protein [Thiotrichales bacterium]